MEWGVYTDNKVNGKNVIIQIKNFKGMAYACSTNVCHYQYGGLQRECHSLRVEQREYVTCAGSLHIFLGNAVRYCYTMR